MTDCLLIYGATGYTGRLMVREALALGLRPILGGRSRGPLEQLARPDALPVRVATLENPSNVAQLLRGVDVLLNAAGPFRDTAPPLARACIEQAVHYLDICGEYAVFESLAALDAASRRKGVMLMPGVGFDVVPSDCLAAWVSRRLPRARTLSIGLTGLNAISRGSAQSVFVQYGDLVMVRRRGQLVRVAPGTQTRMFDFGSGPRRATAVTWADISSAYRTTGIPDITVYYEATPIVEMGLAMSRFGRGLSDQQVLNAWRRMGVRMLADGPSAEQRARDRAAVVVEATDGSKTCAARVHTPEVYSFTATTAVAIADRVLTGDRKAGFQTPSGAYGADFTLSLPGVTWSELS